MDPLSRLYVFLNDNLVPLEKATLHVSDLSIQRGYGVFDFFKVSDGHPFFLDDYLDRFYRSASIMRLAVPYNADKLRGLIYRLIEKNNLAESGIKMILTGGYSTDGYHPDVPNLILTQHPLILPGKEVVEKGVKIITHEYVRDLPEAKTINYSMGIWLDDKIKSAHAADVLYHQQGVVSEFPRCNFFIVTREQKVITPAHAVLQGVTRKNVLKLASNKFVSEEATVTIDVVRSASEAFLTSTTKRVIPIVAIDGIPVGHGKPGPVSLSLLEDLVALESEDKRINARPQKFYGF
jgi:D-alanine transaminase/branched-chain amino acid aminotransferase